MRVLVHNELSFNKQLSKLKRQGGFAQRAAQRVMEIIGNLSLEGGDPEAYLGRLTKQGETRIPHAKKIDLPGAHRLVIISHERIVWLANVGSHDEIDRWCKRNRGLVLKPNPKTGEINLVQKLELAPPEPTPRPTIPLDAETPLLDFLLTTVEQRDEFYDALNWKICPRKVASQLGSLTRANPQRDLYDGAITLLEDELEQAFLYDLLCALSKEDSPDAPATLLYEFLATLNGQPQLDLHEALAQEVNQEAIIDLRELSVDEYTRLLAHSNFRDWLLYLHPDQKRVVEEHFPGAAVLRGVSGSGKTCVLVHRANALARLYPGEQIGIFTLNRSLARLLADLLDDLVPSPFREQIEVSAIYDLCERIVRHYAPDEHLQVHDPKSGELLEDCWLDSYARDEQADRLEPIIASLWKRGFDDGRYLRDEFIWVRSAFASDSQANVPPREHYEDPSKGSRKGRAQGVPFSKDWRQRVLDALSFYESWLETGGFVDPAALSLKAHRFLPNLLTDQEHPFMYRVVMADEVQDLSTVELEILAGLPRVTPNSLFLTGDSMQQVHPREHSLQKAGIEFDRREFRKNYRNPKEILEAGYELLTRFGQGEEIALKPRYSKRHSSKPLVIAADDRASEMSYVSQIVAERLKEAPQPICVVVCGLRQDDDASIRSLAAEYREFGMSCELLTEDTCLEGGKVFLSSLETVKGFEFSLVVITNCNDESLPDPKLPEPWRDARRLYVALTRARDEAVFTHAGTASRFLKGISEFLQVRSAEAELGSPPGATGGLTVNVCETEGLHGVTLGRQALLSLLESRRLAGNADIDRVGSRNTEDTVREAWHAVRHLKAFELPRNASGAVILSKLPSDVIWHVTVASSRRMRVWGRDEEGWWASQPLRPKQQVLGLRRTSTRVTRWVTAEGSLGLAGGAPRPAERPRLDLRG